MRQRTIPALALLILSIAALPALSGEKHRLLGTWSVDVSRLEQADPPASVTMRFSEAGEESYRLSFDIVAADGTTVHAGGQVFKADRSVLGAPGSPEVDVVTFSMPNRKTLIMGGAYQGHPAHTRIWSLSDDGNSMTETIVGHIDGNTPHIRVARWTRSIPAH